MTWRNSSPVVFVWSKTHFENSPYFVKKIIQLSHRALPQFDRKGMFHQRAIVKATVFCHRAIATHRVFVKSTTRSPSVFRGETAGVTMEDIFDVNPLSVDIPPVLPQSTCPFPRRCITQLESIKHVSPGSHYLTFDIQIDESSHFTVTNIVRSISLNN